MSSSTRRADKQPDELPRGRVEIPAKLVPVFTGRADYRGAHGGRGSAKSRTFAAMAAVRGYSEPLRILCAREIQNSIEQSSMAEVKAAIEQYPWLREHYSVGQSYIRGRNGTEFFFRGLLRNIDNIRSLSRIHLVWVEEAENVSEQSWQDLIPTIREEGSEIWLTWNPKTKGSATDRRFRLNPPPGARIAQVNWRDNPWFPEKLRRQREYDYQTNQEHYGYIWEGEYMRHSAAQVLRGKWRVAEFTPREREWDGPYHGMDFGFSQDPFAAVRLWRNDGRLYIEHEAWKVELDLHRTTPFVTSEIPGIERFIIRADNARPESISYLKSHGLPRVIACDKWPGSVEDGIAHLRSYDEIIIHPRCVKAIEEANLYSYKTNRAGDILDQVADSYNHIWDATRYALGPLITRKGVDYSKFNTM